MRISLLIPTVVFCYAVRIVSSNCVQVGTVLFTTTDLVKKCWSESDKALLRARIIMQDVLPDPDCIDFSKPDAVLTLLDYFQSCYNIIGVSTYGKLQNLMYVALSDAIGGYLRGYALPLTKKAFYSGLVKYSEAKKLFRLYDDIRAFLKTNGLGWSKPQTICRNKFRPKPLVIGDSGGDSPCDQLYIIEKKSESKSSGLFNLRTDKFEQEPDGENLESSKSAVHPRNLEMIKDRRKLRTEKRSGNHSGSREMAFGRSESGVGKSLERRRGREKQMEEPEPETNRFREEDESEKREKKFIYLGCQDLEKKPFNFDLTDSDGSNGNIYGKVVIPLPILEECQTLHTIAVPFKIRPLRNVQTKKSAFVLEHYYITAIKCLVSKSSSQRDIKNFNSQFHSWMVSEVYPHLNDEQWYPAFGGVYRITETIRKLGSDKSSQDPGTHDVGFIFSRGFEFEDEESGRRLGKEKVRDVGDDFSNDDYAPSKYFIFSVLILIIVSVCVFCVCISYCCATNWKKMSSSGSNQSSQLSIDDKFLNFQFFVRFFKKQTNDDEEERTQSEPKMSDDDLNALKKSQKLFKIKDSGTNDVEKKEEREANKRIAEEKQVKQLPKNLLGAGDVPSLMVKNLESVNSKPVFKPVLASVWPYHTTFLRFEKMGTEEKSHNLLETMEKKTGPIVGSALPKTKGNELEVLWKKPSNKGKETKLKGGAGGDSKGIHFERNEHRKQKSGYELKKGDRQVKTMEKSHGLRCSSCGYSETCVTSTHSSSYIQIEEEISTETPNVFARKHKAHGRQQTVEESTEESESDRDASYSSETESTETTQN